VVGPLDLDLSPVLGRDSLRHIDAGVAAAEEDCVLE